MRSGSGRLPLAPLAALFALAVLAMAWVASAHVCSRPIVMTMAGMDMPAGAAMPMPMMQAPAGTLMICPVVVGLIVLATLLGAAAIVTGYRDPHRALTLSVVMRALARLPVARTFGALAGAGGVAIAAIVAVDGHGALSPALCATLALVLGGISIAATVASVVVARIVTALCTRLLMALTGAIAVRGPVARAFRFRVARASRCTAVALAFGRGLRAPPLPTR